MTNSHVHQKYVDCYPTNGSRIAFTGISGQIDTHERKGTYVVRWVGAAAGPIWIAVLRPDVQIGFSLDGKLLMDAIYDGDDWVDHYTWRLVGSDDNGDVVFDGLCPKHLHPFVSSLIESSARVAPYSSASLHDTDVLKTIRESIDEGTMSGPLFSRLVGLDEIGSKRLLAGEKVELTYRSMISILRLADVLRK